MGKSLVIVESPAKAKTIKKYLGDDFEVEASVGHIKDLPTNELGVDIHNNFEPQYVAIRGKAKIIQKLKSSSKHADAVYLAPDPDREGEAIAWHIAQELRRSNDHIYRVTFNEITKSAVTQAIAHPRVIDVSKFESQQARRILDRLVGYEISPLLWDKVRRGLSAGRVQSVAVRLVVERERDVLAFVPTEYWSITADLALPNKAVVEARLVRVGEDKAHIPDAEAAQKLAKTIESASLMVTSIQRKERRRSPQPPFITSKLQQEAARWYRFTAKRTMVVAQQLYEGIELGDEGAVGLITYMRTDSLRLSNESVEAVRQFVKDTYGPAYLPDNPVQYKTKKSAQDAHEAIRPTNIALTPEAVRPFLDGDQYKLYSLIWKRTVACQMTPVVYDGTSVDIVARPADGGVDLTLRVTGSVLKFDGYTVVYREAKDEDSKDEDDERVLPPLDEGMTLVPTAVSPNQHFTEPPPRYTEATLIRELEEKGIGRPSTYATILSTIQDKEYVKKDGGRFRPTELGTVVTDLLVESFPHILNVEFTARMEDDLDRIEDGHVDWKNMLHTFYAPFQETLSEARENMRNLKTEEIPTHILCDKCGQANLAIRFGKNGSFLGCPRYPDCKNTAEYERDENGIVTIKHPERSGERCEKCSRDMLVKSGKYGRFLACSGYPECVNTRPIPVGVKCPREGCTGDLIEKLSKKKKVFYSCSRYPECNYATWNRPIPNRPCPQCSFPFLAEKNYKGKNEIVCESCSYSERL